MTNAEAIKHLKKMKENCHTENYLDKEALDKAILALEDVSERYYKCAVCGKTSLRVNSSEGKLKWCRWCGGKEEEEI